MAQSEKAMATHSSVAWRIPGTAGPGGLPSMGSHRVGHDYSDLAAAAAAGHLTSENIKSTLKKKIGQVVKEITENSAASAVMN